MPWLSANAQLSLTSCANPRAGQGNESKTSCGPGPAGSCRQVDCILQFLCTTQSGDEVKRRAGKRDRSEKNYSEVLGFLRAPQQRSVLPAASVVQAHQRLARAAAVTVLDQKALRRASLPSSSSFNIHVPNPTRTRTWNLSPAPSGTQICCSRKIPQNK